MGVIRRAGQWTSTLLVLAVLAGVAAGCTGGPLSPQSDMAPKDKQVLHYQLVTGSPDIAGLDPDISFNNIRETSQSAHAGSLLPISLIFSGLVTLDKNLLPENWDAQRIDVSQDGLKYTFHLRQGLRFSDGKPVTAADYAFSINRTLDPCVNSPVAPYLYEIKDALLFNAENCTAGTGGAPNTYGPGYGQTTPPISSLLKDSVIAVDPSTLVITLSAPAAFFLTTMAYPCAFAIEPSVVGGNALNSTWTDGLARGPTGQGGSGPFYVSSWDHKGSLVLKANPYFRQQPHIQTLDISIYADAASAYKAYQSGKDDIGYPPAADLAQAIKQPNFHQQGTIWVNYLGLNWQIAPFDDVRARQAFALALNRNEINASQLSGAQLPTNHIVPQGMPGYNAGLKGPDMVASTQGDLAKAQALWQQYVAAKCGGKASGCPAVTLTYSSDSATAGKVSQAMHQMWKSVLGVDVSLQPESLDTMLGQVATGTVQLWNIGWRGYYPDPQDWLSLQFLCCPAAPYNFGHVNVPAASKLMEQADVNPDQVQRFQQYQQAEQMLVDQVAWVPYGQVVDHWQSPVWIKGYGETALGEPSLDQWLSMYIANH